MSHTDKIKDCDAFFEVDPITRQIKNMTPTKVILMQGDHNSERFTFSLPRYIEGHDMANCSNAKVHYINPSRETQGTYIAKDLRISPDDEEKVIMCWLISGNVTKNSGKISFLIEFECFENDELVYCWHTAPYNEITIGETFNCDEEIYKQYADILEQWKLDIDKQIQAKNGLNNVTEIKAYYIKSIDFENKKIYLTKTQPVIPSLTEHIADESILEDEAFYEVGDTFSIISEYHYPACGVIAEIDENRTITYTGDLPFTEVFEDNNYDGNTFNVAKKSHIGCTTITKYAFAAGIDNIAAGQAAMALGFENVVYDSYGAAIGLCNAAGYAAISLNALTEAMGNHSLTFGQRTKTNPLAKNGVAGGFGTVAGSENQFVFGKFNIVDEKGTYIFVLGNGSSNNNLSNAFTVDWNGNGYFAGNIYSGKNKKKLITSDEVKKYVGTTLGDNNISNANNIVNIGYNSNLYGKGDISVGHNNSSEPEMVILIGSANIAKGTSGYGVAIGYKNQILHGQAYLLGKQLLSSEYEQTIVGRNNLAETNAIFIIGNGANTTDRANALKIEKTTSNAYFAGDIYSKGKKLLTSEDVDTLNAEIESLKSKIEALEDERVALNDTVSFLNNDIISLVSRIEALENK